MNAKIPENVTADGLEDKWSKVWQDKDIYAFDRKYTREEIFAVDTPPPTVSGSLHLGHVFSYTHTDTIVRFQRMSGKHPFYPMGWDDNGLPTERRVQNYYGVTCDPSVEYDPNFTAPEEPLDPPQPISRRNFTELCSTLVSIDEEKFEELWKHLGLSVDWKMTYTTVGKTAQEISQRAFLKMVQRGEAYNSDAPTLWDVDFKTAVAQAEIEDREKGGKFYKLAFPFYDEAKNSASDEYLIIETTRPELIAADVGVAVNPKDERFTHLVGKKVLSPVFGVPLEIFHHEIADPEKGSGVVMISTWGDISDVQMWRELDLPVRSIIGRDGKIIDLSDSISSWGPIDPEAAKNAFSKIAGLYPNQAKKVMEEMLRESGSLLDEPKEIMRPVKFYEKGDRPLEVVASRQWYIKNGGRDRQVAAGLKDRGSQIHWHPKFMESRYQNWVDGLNGDWLISRQRYFGVPIPIWYHLDENGEPNYEEVLVPDSKQLPVDPSIDVPNGYDESQRNQPNGFMADPDIFDTWATSSLTPQIAGQWSVDDELFEKVFPMDLRPQAHEIIRTWLFSTVVRSHYEHNSIPFYNALISGWILDPDRKKMSKSKGNVVTPMGLLEQYGSDAVRYWAANGRPGVDTAYDEGIMKIGRRLSTKLLNASKFVLTVASDFEDVQSENVTENIDKSFLAILKKDCEDCQKAFNDFDYSRSLQIAETRFWDFCDNYLEIVKSRAYGSQGDAAKLSAQTTLRIALSIFQRLFAPIMPFVTEEVWSWWQEGSIHHAKWPQSGDLPFDTSHDVYATTKEVVTQMRTLKSEAKISMKTEVTNAKMMGANWLNGTWLDDAVLSDIRSSCNITDPDFSIGNVIKTDSNVFWDTSQVKFALKND
ncbi:MAG: valine--tRNA ligase [Acidimicrobiia bacterium]